MSPELKEVVDRTRRIETRLTKYLEAQGFETQAQRPLWKDGTVHVPSPACSIKDILAVVPNEWDREAEIEVYHRLQPLMSHLSARGST
jgi:hypothetical protein